VQYHPEYKSTVANPHPILLILLQRLYKQRRNNRDVVKHLPKFGTNRLNTFKYYNGTKKFDLNSIIGFALIFWYFSFIMYQNQPDQKWLQLKSSKELQIKTAKPRL
jgi:hypothetical protein